MPDSTHREAFALTAADRYADGGLGTASRFRTLEPLVAAIVPDPERPDARKSTGRVDSGSGLKRQDPGTRSHLGSNGSADLQQPAGTASPIASLVGRGRGQSSRPIEASAVDRDETTAIGRVQELGCQGSIYEGNSPACRHEEPA